MDFDKLLFRASANGDIMNKGDGELTEIQANELLELVAKRKEKPLTPTQEEKLAKYINKRDNPVLSKTCIKRLVKMYAKALGREEEIRSKYTDKGTTGENNGITLYSRIKKKAFFKNEAHLTNKYVEGTPDMGDGETIQDSEEIIDIKLSWSLITFLEAMFDKTNPDYQWQGDTYLALVPKAKRFRLAYCLVNSPAEIIVQEKKKKMFQMLVLDDQDPEYKEECRQIERNHIFDIKEFVKEYPHFDFDNSIEEWVWDIPMEDRMFEIVIERNNDRIAELYKKVERCRRWLDEKFNRKKAA